MVPAPSGTPEARPERSHPSMERIWSERRQLAVSTAFRMCRDRIESEDIAHSAILRLLVADPARLTPEYVRTAVRNEFRDRARAARLRRNVVFPAGMKAKTPDPEEAAAVSELMNRVADVIDNLPPASHECFVRVDLHGDSIAEVAKSRGVSAKAVQMRLALARKLIRRCIDVG